MLARDIWRTAPQDTDRLCRLWVSLTYSVGNFKRQGNTGIFPLPSPWTLAPLPGQAHHAASLTVPINGSSVRLDSTGTSAHLSGSTRGLSSVPTGSALLTALWPEDNAILDIRDFQVAVALLADNGAQIVGAGETASLYAPNWSEYKWFRTLMKVETARLRLPSLMTLERALFVAYDFFPPAKAANMTWQQWGASIRTDGVPG